MPGMDFSERLVEGVQAEELHLPRNFIYIAGAVLAWAAFWELAERHHENAAAQTMAWTFVFIAVWAVYTF